MTYFIVQSLNGLFSAALLFLIASGLTLAFGVMRIVNIAHGSFYMLGVYVAYTVAARTSSLLAGTLLAVLVVAAIGFLMQRLFLRRFAAQPLAQMMMTMGFALFFRDAALMIWGGDKDESDPAACANFFPPEIRKAEFKDRIFPDTYHGYGFNLPKRVTVFGGSTKKTSAYNPQAHEETFAGTVAWFNARLR